MKFFRLFFWKLLPSSIFFLPLKVDISEKRPAIAATKTSAPFKKAKLVTPEKSGGKTSKLYEIC